MGGVAEGAKSEESAARRRRGWEECAGPDESTYVCTHTHSMETAQRRRRAGARTCSRRRGRVWTWRPRTRRASWTAAALCTLDKAAGEGAGWAGGKRAGWAGGLICRKKRWLCASASPAPPSTPPSLAPPSAPPSLGPPSAPPSLGPPSAPPSLAPLVFICARPHPCSLSLSHPAFCLRRRFTRPCERCPASGASWAFERYRERGPHALSWDLDLMEGWPGLCVTARPNAAPTPPFPPPNPHPPFPPPNPLFPLPTRTPPQPRNCRSSTSWAR